MCLKLKKINWKWKLLSWNWNQRCGYDCIDRCVYRCHMAAGIHILKKVLSLVTKLTQILKFFINFLLVTFISFNVFGFFFKFLIFFCIFRWFFPFKFFSKDQKKFCKFNRKPCKNLLNRLLNNSMSQEKSPL